MGYPPPTRRRRRRDTGHQRVTLADIAQRCGLSKITISCALRGDRGNCSEKTIARVQAAARAMGYDPALAHAARRLRYIGSDHSVLNHLVALFFPFGNLHIRYWALIFEGIQTHLSQHGFGILSCALHPDRPLVGQLPQLFHRGDVDGVLVFPDESYRDNLVQTLRDEPGFSQRPVVTVIDKLPGCSALLVDDEQVGYLAAAHLLDLGHRELLCFASSRYTSPMGRARLDGFRRAITERGGDPARALHVAEWLWDDPRGLAAALRDEFTRHPGITGILCPNDGVGIPVWRALRQLGKQVPRDYSIIGADDCEELLNDAGENIWTTVRLPLRRLGEQAAEVLLVALADKSSPLQQRILSSELVVRGTTAAPRSRGT